MNKAEKDLLAEIVAYNIALEKSADGKFLRLLQMRLAKRVKSHFDKQKKHVLEAIRSLSFLNPQNAAKDGREIAELVENIPGQEAVVETIAIFWRGAMLKGGKRSVTDLNLGEEGISFSLTNKQAVKWLKNKKIVETAKPGSAAWTKAANELRLSNYKGNIHTTTKERIKNILSQAANEGWSYNRTADAIRAAGESGVFSKARGELIAVREIGSAYEQGKFIPVDDFAKAFPDRQPEKSWLTKNDNRVTPSHTKNQDQGWIKHDEEFTGTGDLTAPADTNPRCRCVTVYRIPPAKK